MDTKISSRHGGQLFPVCLSLFFSSQKPPQSLATRIEITQFSSPVYEEVLTHLWIDTYLNPLFGLNGNSSNFIMLNFSKNAIIFVLFLKTLLNICYVRQMNAERVKGGRFFCPCDLFGYDPLLVMTSVWQ
jgi:hypothetical protein